MSGLSPHRTVLWAQVDTPVGPWDVFTTHLSHGFDQSALRCVNSTRSPHGSTSGDEPMTVRSFRRPRRRPQRVPDSDEIRRLTGRSAPAVPGLVFSDCWEHVGTGDGATYSASNPYVTNSAWPERRLDYVMSVASPATQRQPDGSTLLRTRPGRQCHRLRSLGCRSRPHGRTAPQVTSRPSLL